MDSLLTPVRPVFRAVVTTLIPDAAALDESSWHDLESLVEDTVAERPPALQRQLRMFLRAIQWWPLLRHGKSFTNLRPAARAHFLSYLQDHRIPTIRVGFWGLRTLALLGFYGRAQACAAIGYRADARGWEARP